MVHVFPPIHSDLIDLHVILEKIQSRSRYLPLEAPVIRTFWPVSEKRSSDGMVGVGSRLGAAGEAIEYLDIDI